jgi:hypothetical protein
MSGALTAAMRGKTSTPRKTSTSTGVSRSTKAKPSAAENLDRLKNRIQKASAQYKAGVSQTVHTAEIQGSLALSAFAAGYLGPEKMRLWGNHPLSDARLLVGGGATAWGLMQAFDGSVKDMAGNHTLALGTGVLASVVYENAHNMGVDLAVKRQKAVVPAKLPEGSPRQGFRLSGMDYAGEGEAEGLGYQGRTAMGARLSRRG